MSLSPKMPIMTCGIAFAARLPLTHANYLGQKTKSQKVITLFPTLYGNHGEKKISCMMLLWYNISKIVWSVGKLAWGNPIAHVNVD